MFIAKDNETIVLVNNSKEELKKQLKFMIYTDIIETSDEYILVKGNYETIMSALSIKKNEKNIENSTKAQQAIQNGYVVFKDAQFETNSQTVGDLTATRDLMKEKEIPSWEWLSRDDKKVTLTLADFTDLGILIATYKNIVWNEKYLDFKAQIDAAITVEDVRAIEIDYNIPKLLESIER